MLASLFHAGRITYRDHLIPHLRRTNHPKLMEYLAGVDRLEEIGCALENVVREIDEWERLGLRLIAPHKVDDLERRFEDLHRQFWPNWLASEELKIEILKELYESETKGGQ
jgi:hypothetical protein